ncbi:MAG TPA: hypothetical protein VLB79_13840 [Solirubrobacterales bacterium]|nr:hypothetical protein [Solirubrobacterales bacterium]
MIVAIVALIAALGGSAIAGGAINKKKAKNIANNVVTQRAPGLAVASAKSADNATNATHAAAASSADNVLWASVHYSDAQTTTQIKASSPGVTGAAESFGGAPTVHFPRNMTNCAITSSVLSGGGTFETRQSTNSSGNDVVIVIDDAANANDRQDFSIMAVCP